MSGNEAGVSRSGAMIVSLVSLFLILLGNTRSSYATSPVSEDAIDASCVPMFAVSLPVFGPAGSVPRVDAALHRNLTVTMKEIDQAVLPLQGPNLCGINFRKTRVWA
jgi:spore coat protein A, manganese oxidase